MNYFSWVFFYNICFQNNIIGAFSKLEQILTSNGYTTDDMIITSCPSAEQVSILLSSASILATEAARKISTSSMESGSIPSRKISTAEKKVSFDSPAITEEQIIDAVEKVEDQKLVEHKQEAHVVGEDKNILISQNQIVGRQNIQAQGPEDIEAEGVPKDQSDVTCEDNKLQSPTV